MQRAQAAQSPPSEAQYTGARRVAGGYVDLFIAPLLENCETGERYHLVRVDLGDPLFHVELPQDRGFVLIEAPGPNSRIEPLDVTSEEIDRWVAIFMGTGGRNRLGAPRMIAAGEYTAETPEALVTDRVLWVRPTAGSLRFNDILELRHGIHFPLAPGAFLASSEDVRMECIATADLVRRGLGVPALAEFHRTMLGSLALRLLDERERAADRLARRTESEQSLFDRAFREMAADPEADKRVYRGSALASAGGDPLRLACHAVWDAAGIAAGRDRTLRVSEDQSPTTRTLERRQEAAEALARGASIRARRIQLPARWWTLECGPLLAWTNDGSDPVALTPRAGGYDLLDPLSGRRVKVTAAIAATLAPSALMFYRPLPDRPLSFGDVFRFPLQRLRPELWRCAWTGAASALLALFMPIATGVLVDYVIPSGDRDQLIVISALLLAATLASATFMLTRQFALLRLEVMISGELLPALWDRLLRLPVSFFRRFTVGDLAHRALIFDDARRSVAHPLAQSIFTGITALFQVILLLTVNGKLAALGIGLLVLACAVSVLFARLQTTGQKQIADIQGKLAGRVLQLLNGVPKFRGSGAERRMFVLWAEQFRELKRIEYGLRIRTNRSTVFQAMFPAAGCVLLFAVAGQPDTGISTGVFVMFLAAFLQTLAGVAEVSTAWTRAAGYFPPLARVRPILEATAEVQPSQEHPGELSGVIEVSHVSFRYGPGQPLVLRDLSFRIQPGQMVAFVGDSGTGKSTLVRLLLGFDTPEGGAVRYDGQDLAGLDIEAVRKQMGVVLQNGRLLNGDILSNIVGATGRGIEDAWEAARLAGIADEIRAMPMGMYTLVGDGGSNLSGGQRQRLLMARAIVARPRILLLDEATSALDNQTQATVTRALESLRATRIVIAHRLSTIQAADRIFVLDGGRIAETGTFDELIALGGKFAQLAQRQLL